MKVWDLPTRLFHWLIVLLVGFSWWSAETGNMDWHYRSGLTALVLLVFRLLWGFIGGSTARFSQFLRSPGAVITYLREPAGPLRGGHNPLPAGGVAVNGIGPNRLPIDWEWRRTEGARVFSHAGNDLGGMGGEAGHGALLTSRIIAWANGEI